MRILWLSNCVLSDEDNRGTGTWLGALAHRLVDSGEVVLANIAGGRAEGIRRQDSGAIQQWILPGAPRLNRDGLPSVGLISEVVSAVEQFSPDLVHVWGTESYWGLLTARKLIRHVALLETQGLKFAIARVYSGGLSIAEQVECIGLKEVLRGTTIFQGKRDYSRWGAFEGEIIAKHHFITVQSPWLESQIRQFNPSAVVYYNEFSLRAPFHSARQWSYSGVPTVFCSAAYSSPFKGLHVATRALKLLKRQFPSVQLRIAGAHQLKGVRRDGYIAWILRELQKQSNHGNVTWLGPLSASQIVDQLLDSSAMVIPSYIEGYCLGLAEAMILGVPSVVAFAGGAPNLAEENVSALFFPPGDDAMCAYQLGRVLTDKDLAVRLSSRAREIGMQRNDPHRVVERQRQIYHQVIAQARGQCP